MDEAHALRDRVGADVLSLVVRESDVARGQCLAPSASIPTILPLLFLPTSWVTTWGWRTIDTNRT